MPIVIGLNSLLNDRTTDTRELVKINSIEASHPELPTFDNASASREHAKPKHDGRRRAGGGASPAIHFLKGHL